MQLIVDHPVPQVVIPNWAWDVITKTAAACNTTLVLSKSMILSLLQHNDTPCLAFLTTQGNYIAIVLLDVDEMQVNEDISKIKPCILSSVQANKYITKHDGKNKMLPLHALGKEMLATENSLDNTVFGDSRLQVDILLKEHDSCLDLDKKAEISIYRNYSTINGEHTLNTEMMKLMFNATQSLVEPCWQGHVLPTENSVFGNIPMLVFSSGWTNYQSGCKVVFFTTNIFCK